MGNIIKKLVIGLVVGGALFLLSRWQEFPFVFQVVFFGHAMFGAAVFMLLDASSVRTMGAVKSTIAIVVFYVVLCTVFVAGASMWPQFDPEDEKGKIAKLLAPKRAATEQGKAEELIARTKALDEQVKALEVRLRTLGADQPVAKQMPVGGAPPVVAKAPTGDFMKIGEEQWQLHECYNCHKLKGEGGKKRGPELDNIGSYLTAAEIKQKIFNPKSYMAEGFEKEWEKGKMPDKFKDVMEDSDAMALATWLSTFKNTSVNTPKPIKKL